MKNVNGLLNAMRVVESGCEKDEITIIGEGAMPTAKELLAKCAHFIEEKYGVSIKLAALVNDEAVCYAKGEVKTYVNNCPCGDCCDCCDCEEEEVDQQELEVEDILYEIENYLDGTILAANAIEDIMNKMEEYFSVIDFVVDGDYSGIKSSMYTILDEQTDGLIVSGGIINADEMVEVIMEIVANNTYH